MFGKQRDKMVYITNVHYKCGMNYYAFCIVFFVDIIIYYAHACM